MNLENTLRQSMRENQENNHFFISFDIGIKNLAYCILQIENGNENPKKFKIIDWNCVNLLEDLEEKPESFNCCFHLVEKKKTPKSSSSVLIENTFVSSGGGATTATSTCGKKALYSTNNNLFFCKKHIPENYILPEKQFSPASIKKLKVPELLKIYQDEIITGAAPPPPHRRSELLEKIIQHYENIQLKKIQNTKKINSKHVSLITIGEKLKTELDKIIISNHLSDKKITILIENQISTIASRMTSIQAMIVQYFISGGSTLNAEKKIELVSSRNKLKHLLLDGDSSGGGGELEENTYKNNKKNGILFCRQILEKNLRITEKLSEGDEPGASPVLSFSGSKCVKIEENDFLSFFLSNKKKDDLADCFLQGYYIINKI